MKVWKAIALVTILIPAVAVAQKKKHNDVPEVFGTAHSAFVQAADGDYSNPALSGADRQAIADVQNALQRWGRYTLTVHAEQADLIFVVRKSRSGNTDAQNGLSGPQRPNGGSGSARVPGQPGDLDSMGAATQMGAEGDRLLVYTMIEGKRNGPIWTRELQGGLDGPSVLLVQQLKSAVERAYPPDLTPVKPAS
ncbi:MAG: hypothetical protein ACLPY1_01765 [Terracidiphilus sp.]